VIGRYELLRRLGEGGMAVVHLARQSDLQRFVALKELRGLHAEDPSYAQRFLREARLAGSINDPNVVSVYEYFEHEGTPFLAMEYLERGSVRRYVGQMSLAQICGVLEAVLHGLMSAEREAIVHRDLKPENVLVTADGRVKIADFGIAKATSQLNAGTFQTSAGMLIGTPTYMAPEQALGENIGPWTDLYSVGCMAFELFTGDRPFADIESPVAVLMRHATEPIPRVEDVDPRIADWIQRLLVKDPSQRTRSAQTAWDELEEIVLELLGPRWRREARLAHEPGETPPSVPTPTTVGTTRTPPPGATTVPAAPAPAQGPPAAPAAPEPAQGPPAATAASATPPPARGPRRRPLLVAGAAGLAALVVLVAVILLQGGGEEDTPTTSARAEIPESNFTANPTFASDTSGWTGFQATVERRPAADAPDGDAVALVTSEIDGDQYAIDDEPDTLDAAAIKGHTYAAQAWVKATDSTDGKPICLAIREYDPARTDGSYVGTTVARVIARTDAYQQLRTSYTVQNEGFTVTLHVFRWSDDVKTGESFYADAITLAPTETPATGEPVDEARCDD
jgi:hypothetical protein